MGDDLLNKEMQDEALHQLGVEDPYFAVIGFPWDPFTYLSRAFPGDAGVRKLAGGMRHLQLVKKIWLNCKRR